MDRNQEFLNTRQELYEYLVECTRNMDLKNFKVFTTNDICQRINVSRNLVSQYLNEYFKKNMLVKVNTRPVYFFDKKTLLEKFQLSSIDHEFDDLDFFIKFINNNMKYRISFDKAIGYNLSLKTVIDKCKVSVEYPPNGLPMHLVGEKGTGKTMLAYLSYQYAVEKGFVSQSEFKCIDCDLYQTKFNDKKTIISEIKNVFIESHIQDYIYIKNYDCLSDDVRVEVQSYLNDIINKGYTRLVISSSINFSDNQIIQQTIPLVIELPSLGDRSIIEKEYLIAYFLRKEEQRINRKIFISEQAYRALVQHTFTGNIEQLKSALKISLAEAFSNSKLDNNIIITILSLPEYIIKTTRIDFKKSVIEDTIYSLEDIRHNHNYKKEYILVTELLSNGLDYINNRLSYKQFISNSYQSIEEYNDYILFKKNISDEKIKIIEQTIMHIFEYIQDVYSMHLSNSFIHIFSKWVYYSDAFNESILYYNEYSPSDIDDVINVIRKESFSEYTIALEIISLIKRNIDVQFSSIEHIILTIFLIGMDESQHSLPIKTSIIAHGYATASSIADVCNKMLRHHIFNAIDMPYDMSVSEIVKQLRKILYYSENRDVLLLVDLGSLENIVELLGEVPNVNLGIINNVSTNLALEIGTAIINKKSIKEILIDAKEKVVTSYRFIEKSKKSDIIVFVSEIGSEIAVKVSELFLNSLSKSIDVDVRCYNYDAFIEFYHSNDFEHYNILFVATTININLTGFPVISIEDIITFKSLDKVKTCLSSYLSDEEFEKFNKNMLNVFSLQNVVESLTILNANKVLSAVAQMLEELQRLLHHRFQPKTIIGLNIHICCLIERLVKKEEIMTYFNAKEFKETKKRFIELVEISFESIAKQYNIKLPISEVAYIYDYINNDSYPIIGKDEDF